MSTRAFYKSFKFSSEGTKNFIKAVANYDSNKNVITPIKNANASEEKTKELVLKLNKRFSNIIGEK